MAGPFPGMDPWLEDSCIWQGVHNSFIVYAAEALQSLIRPRFVARIEARVYIATVGRNIAPDIIVRNGFDGVRGAAPAILEPDEALVLEHIDDEINEAYIQIIDVKSDREVVTAIELLSFSNKIKGEGRDLYLQKQDEVLHSPASLVEIDLLRGGPHVLAVEETEVSPIGIYDYLIAINRSWDRDRRSFVYPRTVRQRLPRIPIPLRSDVPPAVLDLQPILDRVYEAGVFGETLDYAQPPLPRLRPDDQAWAQVQIKTWQEAQQA